MNILQKHFFANSTCIYSNNLVYLTRSSAALYRTAKFAFFSYKVLAINMIKCLSQNQLFRFNEVGL